MANAQKNSGEVSRRGVLTGGLAGGFLLAFHLPVRAANETPAAFAARNATTSIPIVHPAAIDPVGTGLIASLAHPGGNITGLAVLNAETSAKRLQLLQEVVPGLSQGAVLWNAANPANGLAWNLLNVTIAAWLLLRNRTRVAFA